MLKKKKHYGIFTLNFVMFFLSLTLFGGSGISLKIFGIAPFLLFSLLTPYCAFNSITRSAVVGLISGAVLDSISADSLFFNTVILFVLSVAANLLADRIFNRNLKAATVLCFLLTVAYYLFYWLIFIAFSVEIRESVTYILMWILPCGLYTALLSIPFYFIYKHFKKLKEEV